MINEPSVPLVLCSKTHWIVWKPELDKDVGKIKKVPWKPDGSCKLKWGDPANHISFQEAVDAYAKGHENGIEFGGIGFVLPLDSIHIVIDLDDAFDAGGNLKPKARVILDRFGSYAERSPSGNGVHIWIRAKIRGSNIPQIILEGQAVEVFTHNHFVTITGDVLPGCEDVLDCQSEAEAFYAELKVASQKAPTAIQKPARGIALDDRMQCYCKAALESEARDVRDQREGNRNNQLNRAAFSLGRLVGGGHLSEGEVEQALLQAARYAGLSYDEAMKTIQSGLEAGKRDPRTPEIEDIESSVNIRGESMSNDKVSKQAVSPVDDSEIKCMVKYDPTDIVGYGVESDGIIYTTKEDKNNNRRKAKVCDGYARIKSQARNEKGEAQFTIVGRGSNDGHMFQFDILAEDFSEERKLLRKLTAHFGAKNLLRELDGLIIQKISKNIETYRLLQAPRWLDGKAAIPGLGLIEGIKFDLPNSVPVDISGGHLEEAKECLKALIESGKPESITVLLDAVLASPLVGKEFQGDRFGIALRGLTGSLKTEYAKLSMAIYGKGYLEESNLLRWEAATHNALSAIAARAGFLPILIDNYKPIKKSGSAENLISVEHMILEGGTKQRLNRDAELKESQEYNCCLLITGEDFPDEASSLARTLVLDWTGAKDIDMLSEAQAKAASLPAIGRIWLTWISSAEGAELLEQARAEFPQVRSKAVARLAKAGAVNPGRIGTTVSLLTLTWGLALRCSDLAPVLEPFSKALKEGLMQLEVRACAETQQATEASKFVEALRELISVGRMVIVTEIAMELNLNDAKKIASRAREGNLSINWQILGWKKDDTGEICVLPSIAREAVKRLRGYDEQNLTPMALYKQLATMGYINPSEKDPLKTVRIKGTPGPRVLVFKPGVLESEEEHLDLSNQVLEGEVKA
jgi:hypothetical protein